MAVLAQLLSGSGGLGGALLSQWGLVVVGLVSGLLLVVAPANQSGKLRQMAVESAC